jgi:hypothetical protein
VPIDNNWIENQIRPIAIGRKNWLFAGSLRAGKRAAAIMSLIQSARLNGHEPFAYLKDVLTRLPTQPQSRIGELLPHRWRPVSLRLGQEGIAGAYPTSPPARGCWSARPARAVSLSIAPSLPGAP